MNNLRIPFPVHRTAADGGHYSAIPTDSCGHRVSASGVSIFFRAPGARKAQCDGEHGAHPTRPHAGAHGHAGEMAHGGVSVFFSHVWLNEGKRVLDVWLVAHGVEFSRR